MSNEELFSEQQASDILARAVRISAEKPEFRPGVTREELERIAAEVGVAPEALVLAIRESQEGPRVAEREGFQWRASFERVVDGELEPEQFDEVLEGLKGGGRSGQPWASQIGRSLNATIFHGGGQTRLNLTSRAGRTKVELHTSALMPFMATLYPCLFVGVFGGFIVGSTTQPWIGAVAGLSVVALGWYGFRAYTAHVMKRTRALADQLRERIAELTQKQEPGDPGEPEAR